MMITATLSTKCKYCKEDNAIINEIAMMTEIPRFSVRQIILKSLQLQPF